MPITSTPKIWMNGELVDWDKAQVHVLTHTLHYGTGVFEGIRAYETDQGPAVFRLTEHIERLFSSAQIMGMEIPYTVDELIAATKETVASTGLDSCYIRPIALLRLRRDGPEHAAVLGRRVDRLLAVGRVPRRRRRREGRADEDLVVDAATTTTRCRRRRRRPGNYVNSSLAKVEALRAGYDEAIMLAPNGLIAECTGENIFVARHGKLLTPPLSAGALEGITQNSVSTIAADLGFDVVVDNIARSDLYIAEEAFVCGTAAEVSSINSVDDRAIPCPGPMTSGDRRGLPRGDPRQGSALLALVRTRPLTRPRLGPRALPTRPPGRIRRKTQSAPAGAASSRRRASRGVSWTGPPQIERRALTFDSTCSHRPSRPEDWRGGRCRVAGPIPVARSRTRWHRFTLTRLPEPSVLVPIGTDLAESSWGGPSSFGSSPPLRCPPGARGRPVDPVASPDRPLMPSRLVTAARSSRSPSPSATRR